DLSVGIPPDMSGLPYACSGIRICIYFSIKKTGNALSLAFPAYCKQMTGIEPASPAWEAGVLPMNYICILHDMNYTADLAKMQDFFLSKLRQRSLFIRSEERR